MKDIKELRKKMSNVPFGNSKFQILNFIAKEETPERAYRNILLQLSQKLEALDECHFRRRRKELDIKQTLKFYEKETDDISKERFQIDIEEYRLGLEKEVKLIEDCMEEISFYKSLLDILPDFTREQFEKGERLYWEKRLLASAEKEKLSTGTISVGTLTSLRQIGIEIKRNDSGELIYEGELLSITED